MKCVYTTANTHIEFMAAIECHPVCPRTHCNPYLRNHKKSIRQLLPHFVLFDHCRG